MSGKSATEGPRKGGSTSLRSNHKKLILALLSLLSILLQCAFLCVTSTWLSPEELRQYAIEVALYTIAFCALQVGFRFFCLGIFYNLIERRKQWELRMYEQKVQRACNGCFKLFYHSWVFVQWHRLISPHPWGQLATPWEPLRQLPVAELWTKPYEVSDEIKWFYRFVTGYLWSELVLLLCCDGHGSRSEFMEMSLHHTISIGLTVASYVAGYIKIGILVMYVHNVSDVFIYLSRTTVDVRSTLFVAVCFTLLCGSFFFYRLYLFPLTLFRSIFLDARHYIVKDPVLLGEGTADASGMTSSAILVWQYFVVMVGILCMLHWHWFCLILRSGLNFARTGEAKDLASSLSIGNLVSAAKLRAARPAGEKHASRGKKDT